METQNTLDSQDLPKQLSDAAWNSILGFLRDCRNVYVGNPETCRHFLSAVLWIAKEGATWRALPKVYGNHWNAIYRRFSRWCDAGLFQALHEHFHDAGASGISLMIMRAHPRQKKRRTRGTSTSRRIYTKLNLSLSDACIPLRFILIAGHRNDITQAPALIEGYSYEYVIGDLTTRSLFASQDAIAVIPPRKGLSP